MAKSRFVPPVIAGATASQALFGGGRRAANYQRLELGRSGADPFEPAKATQPGTDPDAGARAQLRERAKREGFAQGLAEGRAQAHSELAPHIAAIEQSLSEVLGLRSVLAEAYRQEMIELGLAAAEALVQRELGQGEGVVRNLVEQALTALGRSEPLELRLNPADAENLAAFVEDTRGRGFDLTLVQEPGLARGDMRVQSEAGSVESLLHDRIARIRQLVLGELEPEADA